MAKLISGVNDLATMFPSIAKEADGWDPRTVFPRSNKKLPWKCNRHHIWNTTPDKRTSRNDNCPYCSNKKVLVGFNDLQTLFPEIAKEADGWDPSTVLPGSDTVKLSWICNQGHKWETTPWKKCIRKDLCSFCSNRKVLVGFNDLKTRFPEIAKEADGWDPSTVLSGTPKNMPWRCNKGHRWNAGINSRTRLKTNCPYCSNYRCLTGFNDLATLHPEIAKEADGWDPSRVISGSNKILSWQCSEGHKWKVSPNKRTSRGDGCPFCGNKRIFIGFNDLKTRFPEIAKEADGWDPSTVMPGNTKKFPWKCAEGHRWKAKPNDRTGINKTCCPVCADSGFNPDKPAWFYLMKRPGQQQLGITNVPNKRIARHKADGWIEVDQTGPHSGEQILEIENIFKKWLRKEVGLVPGTHENWYTSKMEVHSLAELKEKSGIRISIF